MRAPSPVRLSFLLAASLLAIACDNTTSDPDGGGDAPDGGADNATDGGTSGSADSLAAGACPFALAFDDTHVYFTTAPASGSPSVSEPGNVRRIPLAGGDAETLATEQPTAETIAVTADHVWWTTRGDNVRTGNVRRRAKAGGDVEIVASNEFLPQYLTAAGAFVWYTSWELRRIPTAGGAAEVFFTGPGGRLDTFALDATHAYFGENTFNTGVSRVALADKAFQQLSAATVTSYETRAIAVDDTHVYFGSQIASQNHQRAIFRVPKDGSSARERLLSPEQMPPTILVSGDHLVFAQGADIVTLPKNQANGTPTVAIAGANAGKLWAHAGRVYWTECAGRRIRSAPMP